MSMTYLPEDVLIQIETLQKEKDIYLNKSLVTYISGLTCLYRGYCYFLLGQKANQGLNIG